MDDIFDCEVIHENEKYFYDHTLALSVLDKHDHHVSIYEFIIDEKKYAISLATIFF